MRLQGTWLALIVICAAPLCDAQPQTPARPAVLFLDFARQEHYETYFRQFLREMHEDGFAVDYADVNTVDPARFADFNVIAYLNVPNWDPESHEPPAHFLAQIEALDAHMAAAGGVLVMSHPGPQRLPSLWRLLEPHGLHVQVATIHDPLAERATLVQAPFARTEAIADHPVTRGVRGLWYPVYAEGGKVWNSNTTPFTADDTWTVPVQTEESAFVEPYRFDMQEVDPRAPQARIDGPLPLLALKQIGPGRLAFSAVPSDYHIHGGLAPAWEGITMGPGLNGEPGDFRPLMLNLLTWLAQPSLAADDLGGAETDLAKLRPPGIEPPPPLDPAKWSYWRPEQSFHGVIGARTSFSVGESTPAEYAQAARDAGLDFVIFLEPLTEISQQDFATLKQQCRELSGDDLILVAGLDCELETGDHYLLMAPDIKWPAQGLLVDGTKRFWVNREGASGQAFAVYATQNLPALVGFYEADGGVPWWSTRFHRQCIPVETWRNGRRVGEMLDEYRELAAAGEWPIPFVLSFTDTADALRTIPGSEQPHSVLLADSLQQLRREIAPRPDMRPSGWVTNGPQIAYWQWLGPRDYVADGNWFDWTRYRWGARFRVGSEAGIDEVRVYDGPRLVRRFDAAGAAEFEREIPLVHEKQKNLTLVVTDRDGRTAIGGEVLDRNHLMEHVYCTDRINTLSYSRLPSDGPYGSTVGVWPLPIMAKGPLTDNLFIRLNQDMYRFPGYDGQPQQNLSINPNVYVYTKDGAEGGLIHRRILRPLASADVCIEQTTFEHKFPPGINVRNGWNNHGPVVPMETFRGRLTYTTFVHPGHLPAPVVVDGEIEMLRDGRFADDRPLPLHVAWAGAPYEAAGYSTCVIANTRDRDITLEMTWDGRPQLERWNTALPAGAFAYFYHSLYGPGGIFSIDENLRCHYVGGTLHRANVGLDLRGREFAAGDRFAFRYIAYAGGWDDLPSSLPAERFRDLMGLDGSPGYAVEARAGAVTSTQYILRIDGRGAGFAGAISPEQPLPAILPLVVQGLNDRWCSVLYDRDTRLWRPVAMHDGAAWAHLDLTADRPEPKRLFVGHPFSCDSDDLFLTLVQTAQSDFSLAVHNPTEAEVTTTLTRAPAFNLLTEQTLQATVPAGDTITLTVAKAQ